MGHSWCEFWGVAAAICAELEERVGWGEVVLSRGPHCTMRIRWYGKTGGETRCMEYLLTREEAFEMRCTRNAVPHIIGGGLVDKCRAVIFANAAFSGGQSPSAVKHG